MRSLALGVVLLLAGLLKSAAPEAADEAQWLRPAEFERVAVESTAGLSLNTRQWHLARIRAMQAWNQADGQGITIAILDSGVDADHPDLKGQLLPGRNFMSGDDDIRDTTGHGTAVAGAAAAAFNDQEQVSGLATRARILPLKVSDARGYTSGRALHDAIIHAADRGARVVNASFEGLTNNTAVLRAAAYLHQKGGILVVPAGNTGQQRTLKPMAGVISVAATTRDDGHPKWSSGGPALSISAPGTDLLLPRVQGGYSRVSGTSYASPLVAGVLALMAAAAPQADAAELESALMASAVDLGAPGPDAEFGHGRIDAVAAVQAILQRVPSSERIGR